MAESREEIENLNMWIIWESVSVDMGRGHAPCHNIVMHLVLSCHILLTFLHPWLVTITLLKYEDPFEQSGNTQYDDNDAPQHMRQTQRIPQSTYTDENSYQPMRVQFDTHLLDALSTAYPSHVSYVRNVLLPSLRNFWSETLKVIPASKIEVPLSGGNNAKCAQEVKKLSGFDLDDFLEYDIASNSARFISNIGSDNNVELDSGENSLVYNNKDLVVIVIPVEGTALCPETDVVDSQYSSQLQTLAFATNCQHDQLDRVSPLLCFFCFGTMQSHSVNYLIVNPLSLQLVTLVSVLVQWTPQTDRPIRINADS